MSEVAVNNSLLNRSVNQLKANASVRKLVDRLPRKLKVRLRQVVDRTTAPGPRERLVSELSAHNTLLSQLIYDRAMTTERSQEPKRLLRHGLKVYSQHDEDGLTEEIFRRIGCTDRFFVEFGVGDGLENGTLYCLLKGWSGVWIDGSAQCVDAIEKRFTFLIESRRLTVRSAFITAETIEQHFRELGVPEEFDLLSIDIDNNDYWVWKSITHYRPRVVAIEYNASFKQTVSCVVPYQSDRDLELYELLRCQPQSLRRAWPEEGVLPGGMQLHRGYRILCSRRPGRPAFRGTVHGGESLRTAALPRPDAERSPARLWSDRSRHNRARVTHDSNQHKRTSCGS